MNRIQIVLAFVVLSTFVGCSSDQSPVTPDPITSQQSIHPSNRTVWGYWNIRIDPITETVTIVPDRDVAMHFNIVRLLEVDPCTDCLTIDNLSFLPDNYLLCDFNLRHPFPGLLKLTGFDVRGVLVTDSDTLFPASNRFVSFDGSNPRLIIPDGYTPLFNPVEFPADSAPWPILGYIPGKLASGDDFDGTLNPFMAFSKDNPRRMFLSGTIEKVSVCLKYPDAPIEFGYIVDASWVKVDEVVDPVTDFPPEANCLEPYKLNFQMLSNINNYLGDTAEVQVQVFDHQGLDTISTVSIECPDLFEGEVFLNYSSQSGDDSWLFNGSIVNEYGTSPASYPVLVKAISTEADSNLGELAAYQVKYIYVLPAPDGNGNLIWAKHAGGTLYDYGTGITTLSDYSTVVTGIFHESAIFGEGEPGETVLVSDGTRDIFVARYNPDGTLVWVKNAGGTGLDYGAGITSLSDDSTVVTGSFGGSAVFGQDEPNETVLVSAGSSDIFVARYNPDGDLVWAKRAGGINNDSSMGITTLSDDSTVVTGFFRNSATFGEGEPNETVLITHGGKDIFVARYNPDGTLAWAKSAGGADYQYGEGITALSDDSTVVTGVFMYTAIFGEGEPNETVLVSAGISDVFVARYNPDGTLAWAKRAGGITSEHGYGITTLSDDSTVLTGIFMDSAIFGEGEPNETVLVSDGYWDIFVARYNPDGTLAWAKYASGLHADWGYGIATLSDDSTVVTGTFVDSAIFGEGEPNETVLVSGGPSNDIFVARYNPDGALVWAKRAGSVNTCVGLCIASLPDDTTVAAGFIMGTATFGPGEPNETVLEGYGQRDIFIARYMP